MKMEDNQLRKAINEIMDILEELPPEKIRERFGNPRHPDNLDFEKTIGNTTYIVNSHFDDNSSVDILRKVERMVVSDNCE